MIKKFEKLSILVIFINVLKYKCLSVVPPNLIFPNEFGPCLLAYPKTFLVSYFNFSITKRFDIMTTLALFGRYAVIEIFVPRTKRFERYLIFSHLTHIK